MGAWNYGTGGLRDDRTVTDRWATLICPVCHSLFHLFKLTLLIRITSSVIKFRTVGCRANERPPTHSHTSTMGMNTHFEIQTAMINYENINVRFHFVYNLNKYLFTYWYMIFRVIFLCCYVVATVFFVVLFIWGLQHVTGFIAGAKGEKNRHGRIFFFSFFKDLLFRFKSVIAPNIHSKFSRSVWKALKAHHISLSIVFVPLAYPQCGILCQS